MHLIAIPMNRNTFADWLKRLSHHAAELARGRYFWMNLATMLTTVVAFVVIVWSGLSTITRHGQSTAAPDLSRMTLQEAMLKYPHFRYAVDSVNVVDSVTGQRLRPMSIIAQDPKPNSKVKRGRRLYVSVQQYTPDRVMLPNIWGRDYQRVLAMLGSRRLTGRLLRREVDRAENTVLAACVIRGDGDTLWLDPLRPTQMPEGTTVYLVVASGLGESVSLPDCRCQTYDMARFLLSAADLQVGSVFVQPNVLDTAAAYVYRQSPAYLPELTVQRGQELNLWLTKDPPIGCEVDQLFSDLDSLPSDVPIRER